MSWYRKPNELNGVLDVAGKDENRLDALRGKLSALEPQWSELQSECERLEALRDASGGTYAREVCERFWNARSQKLRDLLLAAVGKRDALTAGLCNEIAELKKKVDARNLALSSVFASWIGQIPPDSAVRPVLEKLRAEARSLTSASAIVDRITSASKLVESDASGQHLPMMNWQTLVRAFNEATQ